MRPPFYQSISQAINDAGRTLATVGHTVQSSTWQGISDPPPMLEVLDVSFRSPMPQTIESMAEAINPNLPWADEHFLERVGGVPTNPGEAYKNWPYYPKNDKKIRQEKFTHSYQERLWPKFAGDFEVKPFYPLRGIRYSVGDLDDVVSLLREQPETRQAFVPIWFPEDTGVAHRGRVPCTIGYLFMQRFGWLHCTYYIRSCDYFRHFRDDIYLACRLTDWVNESLGSIYKLGTLTMHIGSLHCWGSERNILPHD